MCQSLMDFGVTINRPPRDGHMAFVRSPDNVSIELLQRGERKPPRRSPGRRWPTPATGTRCAGPLPCFWRHGGRRWRDAPPRRAPAGAGPRARRLVLGRRERGPAPARGAGAGAAGPRGAAGLPCGDPVALFAFEWSGEHAHAPILPGWTLIRSEVELEAVAQVILKSERSRSNLPTAVGAALGHAATRLRDARPAEPGPSTSQATASTTTASARPWPRELPAGRRDGERPDRGRRGGRGRASRGLVPGRGAARAGGLLHLHAGLRRLSAGHGGQAPAGTGAAGGGRDAGERSAG